MPLFGPPKIDRMLSKKDVRGLLKAMDYQKDAAVRERAAVALGELQAVEALPRLNTAAAEDVFKVARAAVEALGTIGTDAAVEAVQRCLVQLAASTHQKQVLQVSAAITHPQGR